jgi:hypothetical protein
VTGAAIRLKPSMDRRIVPMLVRWLAQIDEQSMDWCFARHPRTPLYACWNLVQKVSLSLTFLAAGQALDATHRDPHLIL